MAGAGVAGAGVAAGPVGAGVAAGPVGAGVAAGVAAGAFVAGAGAAGVADGAFVTGTGAGTGACVAGAAPPPPFPPPVAVPVQARPPRPVASIKDFFKIQPQVLLPLACLFESQNFIRCQYISQIFLATLMLVRSLLLTTL